MMFKLKNVHGSGWEWWFHSEWWAFNIVVSLSQFHYFFTKQLLIYINRLTEFVHKIMINENLLVFFKALIPRTHHSTYLRTFINPLQSFTILIQFISSHPYLDKSHTIINHILFHDLTINFNAK